MTTRYATAADIPEIVRVINAAFRVEDFFIHGNRTNEADVAARMAEPHACILVAEDGAGTLTGAVVVDVHESRGHFAMLSVDPPAQGRGVSRLLLNAVEEHCRSADCSALDIEIVNLREELPAFYKMMGFVLADTAPFPDTSKLKRDAHMVRMTKKLKTHAG